MSKRLLTSLSHDQEYLFTKLPQELIQKIFTQSDIETVCSLLLVNKESFSFLKQWSKEFFGDKTFPNDSSPFSISTILRNMDSEEYYTRENLYLVIKLIWIIGNSPFKQYYGKYGDSFDFSINTWPICDISIMDKKDHCFTPLLKTPGLLVETYRLNKEKSEDEMTDVELYIYQRPGGKYWNALVYSMNESNAQKLEIDPIHTPVNRLLLNGKHILSPRNDGIENLLIWNVGLKSKKTLLEFFIMENINMYQKECCEIIGRVYQCAYCDHHDELGCYFYE